jgi:hypothetical protein
VRSQTRAICGVAEVDVRRRAEMPFSGPATIPRVLLGPPNRIARRFGAALAAIIGACPAVLADEARAGTRARACAGAELQPDGADASAIAAATLCLVDRVRAAHRLRPLRENVQLQQVAVSQLRNMVRLDYFGDDRPSGQTPLAVVSATRYPAHAARFWIGQNIAYGAGAGASISPARIVAAWMASPPHRAVILARGFHDAGVASSPTVPTVLGIEAPAAIYAMEFGARD